MIALNNEQFPHTQQDSATHRKGPAWAGMGIHTCWYTEQQQQDQVMSFPVLNSHCDRPELSHLTSLSFSGGNAQVQLPVT